MPNEVKKQKIDLNIVFAPEGPERLEKLPLLPKEAVLEFQQIHEETLFELENQWRKELSKRDTAREILETMTYQEATDMLEPLLIKRIEQKEYSDKKYKRIKRLVKKFYAPGTFKFDFCLDAVWILHGAKDDLENQAELNRLLSYYFLNESKRSKSASGPAHSWRDNTILIQSAKRILIESLCKNPLRRSGGNRLLGLCPFHKERTPSFTIFTNSNTFCCFGCGEKGDSIAFYQKLYGVSFWDAIKQLTGSY